MCLVLAADRELVDHDHLAAAQFVGQRAPQGQPADLLVHALAEVTGLGTEHHAATAPHGRLAVAGAGAPVPFWRQGFCRLPATSPLVLVLTRPARWLAR
jgi:hypothetical protein